MLAGDIYLYISKTYEFLWTALVLNLDVWSAVLLNDTEWPVLHVLFDLWIINLATDETLSVEDGVLWVASVCVLSRVTDSKKKGGTE
jgi:hypothetical protein